MASRLHPRQITIQGQAYAWTPEGGLEPAVIETVEGWIKTQALAFVTTGERRGLDLDDLIQAGNLGALEAARRFEPDRGSYLAYAKWIIRRCLLEALGGGDEVHQSRRDKRAALKAGELPTVLRLHQPMGDSQALGDTILVHDPVEDHTELDERESMLLKALARLEPQERLLLTLRYGLGGQEPLSLEAVGQFLTPPVGREPARQRQKRAESRLRGALRELGLRASAPTLAIICPPAPVSASATPQPPPNPGTRRADREVRRKARHAALGNPLPFEIPA